MMKKHVILTAGLLCLALSLTACKGKEETSASSSASAVSETPEATGAEADMAAITVPDDYTEPAGITELMAGVDLDACVTLGQYKGLELTKTVQEVSEEDILNCADAGAITETTVKLDKAAEIGDSVNIDYEGKVSEELELSDATKEGLKGTMTIVLGSQSTIDGFEDGIVGMTAGETKELDLTFPKGYSEELSAQPVTFTITLNQVEVTNRELSEDWVKANTDYESLDEYLRVLRSEAEQVKEEEAVYTMEGEAWQKVLETSVINEYPQAVLVYGKYFFQNSVNQQCAAYGMTLEEYLEAAGATMEQYEEESNAYGMSMAAQVLVMAAIEKAENITADSEAYNTKLNEYAQEAGVDVDTFISGYGPFGTEQSIMLELINQLITDNAVIKEVSAAAEASEETVTDNNVAVVEGAGNAASTLPETGEAAAETTEHEALKPLEE